MKIRCKKTGEIYEAVENYSGGTYKQKLHTFRPLPLEEWIERHNEYAKKPNESTGLPKPWDEETEERKERLLKIRATEIWDGGFEYVDVPNIVVFNGYFITSKTGGNMDKGWCKLFSPNAVEIVNA